MFPLKWGGEEFPSDTKSWLQVGFSGAAALAVLVLGAGCARGQPSPLL